MRERMEKERVRKSGREKREKERVFVRGREKERESERGRISYVKIYITEVA